MGAQPFKVSCISRTMPAFCDVFAPNETNIPLNYGSVIISSMHPLMKTPQPIVVMHTKMRVELLIHNSEVYVWHEANTSQQAKTPPSSSNVLVIRNFIIYHISSLFIIFHNFSP